MAKVCLDRVSKMFGDHLAIQDLSFDVGENEFLVMVGPSGCGKSTTLRMLAGLETPSYGRILYGDKDITLTPPGKRGVAMVFQSYALYPHMSVYKNLSFGMEVRRESKHGQVERVRKIADMLGLGTLLDRKPSALSGGQRQRIALGRAMLCEPKLFLLDEPLSNLDAALRTQMRFEIAEMQRRLGVPTVYVTHDQVEAMTMGHRIAVFSHGRMIQIGTPEELFNAPANKEVALFIGSPKMNIVPAELSFMGSGPSLQILGGTVTLSDRQAALLGCSGPGPVEAGLRPHDLHWVQDAPPRCTSRARGSVLNIETTGAETFVTAEVGGVRVNTRFPSFAGVKTGDTVDLAFDLNDLHLFDRGDGRALLRNSASKRPILIARPSLSATG
jgi:multiple sugar transport system ATP-binding protein